MYSKLIRAQVSSLSKFVAKNDPVQESLNFNGMPIELEWLSGQRREWPDKPANEEQKPLHAHYGYIKNSISEDGEELDVYLKPGSAKPTVFLLIQLERGTGFYDEVKYMLGFESKDEAMAAYISSMPLDMFGGIYDLSWEKFEQNYLELYSK
jgi:hypothetical protein